MFLCGRFLRSEAVVMNLASAYAAISTLSILTVDDGMELCVDFYRFKVEGTTAKATKHVHCPDNSTVQGNFAEYKLDPVLKLAKHVIMPQNTEIGTVIHAGEHVVSKQKQVALSLITSGRDATFVTNFVKPLGVIQVSTSNGYVLYQVCQDDGVASYRPIVAPSDDSFRTLNRNNLQLCGLTFGHTPDGLIWESQGQCRKLVVEGKSASLKPEACPKVEKLVFSMTALKNRAASAKGELPDAEVNTTSAVLYLRPKPVTTTTTPEPTTEVSETAVSSSTTEGEVTSTVPLEPWVIVFICVVVGIAFGVLIGLGVYYKIKGKRTGRKSKKRERKPWIPSSNTKSNITSNIKSNLTSNIPANVPSSPTPEEKPQVIITRGGDLVSPEKVDENGKVIPGHVSPTYYANWPVKEHPSQLGSV
ncbi:unnamed protein product [Bursaphelenchus okinawaensis]|uniref:Uncharacterized protein n=1 Tax=Bursaphelenchus okinawaensis TaxID=465554 RepID=A0A811L7J2_9BILA|nr:unnamed protein product [Bursaphelenchus okinawaensis]CAG9118066.1 unnamed protein product [Bursaphelenchus okinawaensis]